MIKFNCKTDVGRVRSCNEDAVAIFENKQMQILVVADGMGGHTAGDVASTMVIDAIHERFNDNLEFTNQEAVGSWVNELFSTVNDKILDYAEQISARKMGTTLVLAIILPEYITFASIGDSRAYILAYDKLRQVTRDHTFVRELLDKGQISERAAKLHPNKNVINKALGVSKTLEYDLITLNNYEIDAILLCTDGLTGLVEDQEILAVLKADAQPLEKIEKLIDKANVRGGRDNISVSIAEFMQQGGEKS